MVGIFGPEAAADCDAVMRQFRRYQMARRGREAVRHSAGSCFLAAKRSLHSDHGPEFRIRLARLFSGVGLNHLRPDVGLHEGMVFRIDDYLAAKEEQNVNFELGPETHRKPYSVRL